MRDACSTRRRVRKPRIWTAVAAALAVHGAIFVVSDVLGLSIIRDGFRTASARALPPLPDDPDLKSSCFDDAVFRISGRSAMCLAPWVGDVDKCLHDAQTYLWIELSGCQARNDPGTAISMIEPRAAEKLTPIDPERLLDEVKPQIKPPQPKPPTPPPAPAEATPPQPRPAPPPEQLKQQVVEVVKPSEEKEPTNARLLSEYNVTVDKQKVARGARNEPLVAKSQQAELTPKEKPRDEPSIQK